MEREWAVPRQQLGALAGVRRRASGLVLHRVSSHGLMGLLLLLLGYRWAVFKFLSRSQRFRKAELCLRGKSHLDEAECGVKRGWHDITKETLLEASAECSGCPLPKGVLGREVVAGVCCSRVLEALW